MRNTLGKEERLKSKKLIESLYAEGKSIKNFPLRLVYLQVEHTSNFPAQAGFSVPKRNFKSAVSRNRIKRLLKEAYRLQKTVVYSGVDKSYIFMISYIGKEELAYDVVYSKMNKLLNLFVKKIK